MWHLSMVKGVERSTPKYGKRIRRAWNTLPRVLEGNYRSGNPNKTATWNYVLLATASNRSLSELCSSAVTTTLLLHPNSHNRFNTAEARFLYFLRYSWKINGHARITRLVLGFEFGKQTKRGLDQNSNRKERNDEFLTLLLFPSSKSMNPSTEPAMHALGLEY
jgi:hypothetical protein